MGVSQPDCDKYREPASRMKQIAMVLLFDRHRRLLVYLRDAKPDIPFPNHWDFFGGHVQEGETPEKLSSVKLGKSWAWS
jgi:8-oxo-dGTP pyrophosphatase MutT (NUDIX family)